MRSALSLTPPPHLGCNEDAPLLDLPGELDRRRTLLPHSPASGLSTYVAGLRTRHGEVPDPDPLDGGITARLLLLLETPGPAITRASPAIAARIRAALAEAAHLLRRN